jgi:hypothetical protein
MKTVNVEFSVFLGDDGKIRLIHKDGDFKIQSTVSYIKTENDQSRYHPHLYEALKKLLEHTGNGLYNFNGLIRLTNPVRLHQRGIE